MVLNWAPEAIVDFFVAAIAIIAFALAYFQPKTRKIRSLFFIRLGILFFALYFFTDGITILLVSQVLSKITLIILFLVIVFFVIGVSYIISESFISVGLIIICCLGSIACYIIFLPGAVEIVFEYGYFNINWIGMCLIIGDLFQVFGGIVLFYWGLKTWLSAPFLIKKEALIFFLGVTISSVIAVIIYTFYYLDPIFIIISDLILSIGIFTFNYAIIKEPKLLYILPFEVNRILVKDRDGFPLFDHDWSESKISDSMFTGFINAVQLMSEEVIHKGGLLDIILTDGILILRESEYITIGLVASKSSKLLRTSIINFANDFEEKFMKLLKTSCRDIGKYDGAYELLDKYFSNFPSKLISSKNHPLYLIAKYKEIPLELENKLKKIFIDETEYEQIKAEIAKFPDCVPFHFMKFYEDNKDTLAFKDEKNLPNKFVS